MKQKLIILGLIVYITIISIGYYDLNERYLKLEINHEYAIEMSKICLNDSELCDEIKKRVFESKNQDELI